MSHNTNERCPEGTRGTRKRLARSRASETCLALPHSLILVRIYQRHSDRDLTVVRLVPSHGNPMIDLALQREADMPNVRRHALLAMALVASAACARRIAVSEATGSVTRVQE